MYFVFIEKRKINFFVAGVHWQAAELAVIRNCRHRIHNHLVHINFPLSAIIHMAMTSAYIRRYRCNQPTIDIELHRLRQIVSMPRHHHHHRVSSTHTSIHVNMKRHCQPHHQLQLIYEHSRARDRKRAMPKWSNPNLCWKYETQHPMLSSWLHIRWCPGGGVWKRI